MKAGDIVIAPEGCAIYLTAGKEYKVIGFWDKKSKRHGHCFKIIDDDGEILLRTYRKSAHLNNQDWVLSTTSHDNPKDNKTITK